MDKLTLIERMAQAHYEAGHATHPLPTIRWARWDEFPPEEIDWRVRQMRAAMAIFLSEPEACIAGVNADLGEKP